MHLGGFLVLLGTIFAALALVLGGRPLLGRGQPPAVAADALLAVAVVLIGIGVLCGNTVLN
jgi:hypothetical protein